MKIAIYGKIRSGKTVACEHLKDRLNCEVIEFSGALQEALDIMYPQHKGTKNRELLISVGQHMRKLDEDVWTNVVKHKINNSKRENILVAGTRQQNEYQMLRKEGFKFIKITADEDIRIERCKNLNDTFDVSTMHNETEKILDSFRIDYEVVNNGNIEEFKKSLDNVLDQIYQDEMNRKLSDILCRDAINEMYQKAEGEEK